MRIAGLVRTIKDNWLLLVILGLGFGLRVWSIGFGLPYMYQPDEGMPVSIALRIVHTGNLDPQFFNWPSLLMYLDALVYLAYFWVGKFAGVFSTPADLPRPDVVTMAVGKAGLPEEFLLGRGLTVLFGTFSILLVYLIARHFGKSKTTGYIAALLLAVDALSVQHSQYIRPDAMAVFFLLLTILSGLKIAAQPRLKYYLLGGAVAGLAACSKYNYGLGFIAILTAHLLQFRARALLHKELAGAILMAILFFLLGTPYAILDPQRFMEMGPVDIASHYSGGHPGAEGSSLIFYAGYLWSTQGLVLVLALVGVLLVVLKREPQGRVILSFPVVYYLFITLYTTHFDNTILPIIPFIAILAAFALSQLYDLVEQRWRAPRWLPALALCAVVILLARPPLSASIANDIALLQPDGREYARQWIDANLPAGSRIAVESYSPYIDRTKFFVEGFSGLQEQSPQWYLKNGFEYLVFSQGIYGRYLSDPTRYPEEAGRYNALFSQFPPVAHFDQNGYEIRVLKTDAGNLPSHRLSARWGVFGPWLELIGYDWIDPTLFLYWRILEPRKEAFTLTTRLLDREGEEITAFSAKPFSATVPGSTGVVKVPWVLVPPAEARPGVYQVELDLDGEGLGRISVLSRDYQPISDKYFIDGLKFPLGQPSAAEWESARPANVTFGDAISLAKYSVNEDALHPGDLLTLTLFWRAQARMNKDYTVFVHLVDAQRNVRAQLDAMPRAGAYPTSVWDAGELVRDSYILRLPIDLTPGEYPIELGLYEYPNLARLAVADANGNRIGDNLILPGVSVR